MRLGLILLLMVLLGFQFASAQNYNKDKRTFREAIAIGVNYQIIHAPSKDFSSALSEINFDVELEKFGISFYAPIGFYFSNYKNSKDGLPSYFYDENILQGAREILTRNNLSFQDTNNPEIMENMTSFSTGLYLNPFFRVKGLQYLHFMVGMTYSKGTVWLDYDGDLNPILNYSYPTKNNYAIDKEYFNRISMVGGLAIVFPYIQFEAGYDLQTEHIFINGGVNLPIGRLFSNK